MKFNTKSGYLIMTREGLMQIILLFFKRCKAYNVPTLMAAGRAGGTAIVITSNAFLTISLVDAPT